MATQQELETVKRQWEADPCFDLADLADEPEFVSHRDELAAHQRQCEDAWQAEARRQAEQQAKAAGVSVDTWLAMDRLRAKGEHRMAYAKRILIHYFQQAGVAPSVDNEGELSGLVEAIIDAAVSLARADSFKPMATALVTDMTPEQARIDALAAHVEAVNTLQKEHGGDTYADALATQHHLRELCQQAPATSLACRDLLKQAEALESAADEVVPQLDRMANWLRARAAEHRRQAANAPSDASVPAPTSHDRTR